MRRPDADTLQRVVLGERRPRRVLLATVVAVLALATLAFIAGFDVRLYDFSGWLVVVPAIAIGAGVARAGLLSGIGSLWLVALWGYVFPPLVGYLTGEWTEAGRYTHPRMLGVCVRVGASRTRGRRRDGARLRTDVGGGARRERVRPRRGGPLGRRAGAVVSPRSRSRAGR